MENKTILITGAAGYIGSSFCFNALKKGFNVVGIDNFSTSSKKNILQLKKRFKETFTFYRKCLMDDNLSEIFTNSKDIWSVVHFAALKNVPESQEKPDLYLKNNVFGTENLINHMHDYGIKRLLFSSSASVYGNQEIQPIKELAKLKPCSVYAETKKISEELIKEATENKKISAISLRYFNPIGSHQERVIADSFEESNSSIMAAIIKASLGLDKNIFIYGYDYDTKDGTGERDYIHISDLIDGHFSALEYLNKFKGYEIFNLGTGHSVSVLELIKTFEKVNSIKINYLFKERRDGDLGRCFADPSKANKELNWEARYNLKTMCKDAWEAIRNGDR